MLKFLVPMMLLATPAWAGIINCFDDTFGTTCFTDEAPSYSAPCDAPTAAETRKRIEDVNRSLDDLKIDPDVAANLKRRNAELAIKSYSLQQQLCR